MKTTKRPLTKRRERPDTAPSSTGAEDLAIRQEAHRINGLLAAPYDVRTVERALRDGIESVRTLRIREDLRPHVEAFVARRAGGGRAA